MTLHCPYCNFTIPAASIASERGRQLAKNLPNRTILRPCPRCGQAFGARQMRKHLPECRKASSG